MAQYGSFPAHVLNDPEFARCGPTANTLWFAGRACADSYGRLAASPQRLKGKVLAQWVFENQLTEEEIEVARDRLIQAGFWIPFTVKGVLYCEYKDWDEDQAAKSSLGKRGRPAFPDPPGRLDLASATRPHKPSQRRQQPDSAQPNGSSDLPAATEYGVLSPGGAEGQAGSESQRAQAGNESPDGYTQLARAHEKHSARLLSTDDQKKLLGVLKDAAAAGVEWQTLLAMMLEKQREFQPTSTMPCIKGVGYYVMTWDSHIREAMRERRTRGSTGSGIDREDPRERLRRERAETLSGAHVAG